MPTTVLSLMAAYSYLASFASEFHHLFCIQEAHFNSSIIPSLKHSHHGDFIAARLLINFLIF